MAPMWRAVCVVFVVYACLDYAGPLVPGAVNFTDDDTVLAGRLDHRPLSLAPPAPQAPGSAELVAGLRPAIRTTIAAPARPVRHQPQSRPSAMRRASSPDPSEDH
jgi:hypothetical protein